MKQTKVKYLISCPFCGGMHTVTNKRYGPKETCKAYSQFMAKLPEDTEIKVNDFISLKQNYHRYDNIFVSDILKVEKITNNLITATMVTTNSMIPFSFPLMEGLRAEDFKLTDKEDFEKYFKKVR